MPQHPSLSCVRSAVAVRCADGDTALILAAWYGHADITKVLLEAAADVDATNCDGNCALNCAAYHGFMSVAELLVEANATIDVRDNVTGKTALIKAAYVGHADVADVLLRSGADRNAMVRGSCPSGCTLPGVARTPPSLPDHTR